MATANKLVFLDKNLRALDKIKLDAFLSTVKTVLTEKQSDLRARIFKDTNDFKGWRALTFAEKKVDLYGINNTMNDLENQYNLKATKFLKGIAAEYVAKASQLIHDNDINGLRSLDITTQQEYRDLVNKTMRTAYVYGKNNAAREMGVAAPADDGTMINVINLTAENIADDHFNKLSTAAKSVIGEQISKTTQSPAQVAALVDRELNDTIKYIVDNTGEIVVSMAINQGRGTTFSSKLDDIYAYQRSEILDERTCAYCLSMDGRIIEKDDPMIDETIFHSNCRGIWVEILMNESDKPDVDGVPNSLRNAYGGAINDLKQPKKPIIKKDSLANKFLNSQEEE